MGIPLADGRTQLRSGQIVTAAERQRFKRAQLAARTQDQIISSRIAMHPDGTKRCRKCGYSLPFHAFGALIREADGLNPRCYGCQRPDTDQENEDA